MSYPNEVLADAPLVYYRLNELSGPTMADTSGNGSSGTVVGAEQQSFLATANSDSLTSSHASSYVAARDGTGTVAITGTVNGSSSMRVGQANAGTRFCYQTFLEFNTSTFSGTAVAAALRLEEFWQTSGHAFTVNVAVLDYGTSVTTADWRSGTQLAALTVIGSLSSGTDGLTDLQDITLDPSALTTLGGFVRLVVYSSRQVGTGTDPTGAEAANIYNVAFTPTLKVTTAGGLTFGVPGLLSQTGNTAVFFPNDDASNFQVESVPIGPLAVSNFSVEALFSISDLRLSYGYFLVAGISASGSTTDIEIAVSTPDSVVMNLGYWVNLTGSGSSANGYNAGPVAAINTTYHTVLTWTASTGTINWYVNGALTDTQVLSSSFTLTATDRFRVGCDGYGYPFASGFPGDGLNGIVDEAAFYTTILSPTRVLAHYTAITSSPNTPQPTAATATGTVRLASSAGGNHNTFPSRATATGGAINAETTAPPPPQPTVTHIAPSVGSTLGGDTIVIQGTNLTYVDTVSFDGIGAASFVVNNDGQITATSPAHTAATVDIYVHSGGGTSLTSPADVFSYNAPPIPQPTVTGVSPNTGAAIGGTAVTVTGTGFTNATGVQFGTTFAVFSVTNDTTISAVAPAHTANTTNVRVSSAGGTSPTSSNNQFSYTAAPGGGGGGGGGGIVSLAGAYAVHLNGIDFNCQPDGDGIIWGWETLEGWFDSPDVVVNQINDFPDGSVITAARNIGRPIVLNGWAVIPNGVPDLWFTAVQKLNQAMDIVTVPALMTVDEPVPMQAYVRRTGRIKTTRIGELYALSFQVPLTAPDPRKYAAATISDSTSLVLTGSNVSVQHTFTIAGTHELPWVATFTGVANDPRITNNTPVHARVQWNGAISGADLVFDSSTHSITWGGNNAYGAIDTASVWFTLQPGNNSIFYNRDPSSPSGTSTCTLSYSPAYF